MTKSHNVDTFDPLDIPKKSRSASELEGNFAIVIKGGKIGYKTPYAMNDNGTVFEIKPHRWGPIDTEDTQSNPVQPTQVYPIDNWDEAKTRINKIFIETAIKEAKKEGFIEQDDIYKEKEKELREKTEEEIKETTLWCNSCKESALNWGKLTIDLSRVFIFYINIMSLPGFLKYMTDAKTTVPIVTGPSDIMEKILHDLSIEAGDSIYELEYDSDEDVLRHRSCGEILMGPGSNGFEKIMNEIR